jgi:hypothetical protein
MIRRWLIRGLALTLLTLCVVAWAASYWQCVQTTVYAAGSRVYVTCQVEAGTILIVEFVGVPARRWNWSWQRFAVNLKGVQSVYNGIEYHGAGFAYYPSTATWPETGLMFPLWFPTLLSALLLWLVWRKTRPAYNGQGFPVEVGGAAGKEVP